jgi:protein-S-isoprenylcysteine O-methyltransferase Ste14
MASWSRQIDALPRKTASPNLVYSDESCRRIKMNVTANLIRGAWLVFVLYWIFASLSVNRIRKREPAGSRLTRWAATIATLVLLNTNFGSVGFLGRRFIPWNASLPQAGAALTWAGIAFAIWARYHIGRYWSGSVALKVGHELIRTGPYAHIRHPIYTGVLMMLGGTALAIGRYGALLAFVLLLADLAWKSKREEALLAREFGPAFEEHRSHTGFFLPRFS